VNRAVVNEDPNTKIIRELKEEVDRLRAAYALLSASAGDPSALISPGTEKVVLKEQLKESENLLREVEKPWEEKLEDTKMINTKRKNELRDIGITLDPKGIKMCGKSAFLVNLHPDPALSELLVYNLPDDGDAVVGCGESSQSCKIAYPRKLKKNENFFKISKLKNIILQNFVKISQF